MIPTSHLHPHGKRPAQSDRRGDCASGHGGPDRDRRGGSDPRHGGDHLRSHNRNSIKIDRCD
eukprot:1189841-Prorocentrum_minimum.AAC.3